MFPSDSFLNRDISKLRVHRLSSMWLGKMSTTRKLHPDFGPSYGDGPDYGIPITVVPSGHPKVSVAFDHASESDRVGYQFDAHTRIEGGRDSGGDMHVVVIEQRTLSALRDLEHPRAERALDRRIGRHLSPQLQQPSPGTPESRPRRGTPDPARSVAVERGEGP